MEEAGCGPADTVMIGDTTYDVEMARAAGVRAVGVGWGYHAPDALIGAGAVEVSSSFPELPHALDRVWAGP